MEDKTQKLYSVIPAYSRQLVSLNILLSEKSNVNDGIKKELKLHFPDNYYNSAYHTRYLKKLTFNKIICIKQLL